jgi:hypothetical protein
MRCNKSLWIYPLVSFFLLTFVLTACGGTATEEAPQPTAEANLTTTALGSDLVLQGDITVTCSQACLDRAQCGTLETSGEQVVLGSTITPATAGHDIFIANNTRASVLTVQSATLQNSTTGETFPLNFYQLNVPNQSPIWVSGWCVQQ